MYVTVTCFRYFLDFQIIFLTLFEFVSVFSRYIKVFLYWNPLSMLSQVERPRPRHAAAVARAVLHVGRGGGAAAHQRQLAGHGQGNPGDLQQR